MSVYLSFGCKPDYFTRDTIWIGIYKPHKNKEYS